MLQMYAIRDSKSGGFDRPFFAKHVAEATRAVQMGLEDPKSAYAKFAEDFSLWLIGTFDPTTGGLIPPSSMAPTWQIELINLLPASSRFKHAPGTEVQNEA